MSEFHRLRAYLERKGTFTEEEFAFLEPLFVPRTLCAGEFLQRAGDGVAHGAFVATGCLRKYVLDAKGKSTSCSLRLRTGGSGKALASRRARRRSISSTPSRRDEKIGAGVPCQDLGWDRYRVDSRGLERTTANDPERCNCL
jgi:hypothetical protein